MRLRYTTDTTTETCRTGFRDVAATTRRRLRVRLRTGLFNNLIAAAVAACLLPAAESQADARQVQLAPADAKLSESERDKAAALRRDLDEAAAASKLEIVSATIANGRLVVHGVTKKARMGVKLDGEFETRSDKSKFFAFVELYWPEDCVITVKSGSQKVLALVQYCGVEGQQGPVGPKGATGPRGRKGVQGVQGPIGEPGPAGPEGAEGVQGPAGAGGAQGPAGDNLLFPGYTATQIVTKTCDDVEGWIHAAGAVACVAVCDSGEEGLIANWRATSRDDGAVTRGRGFPQVMEIAGTAIPSSLWSFYIADSELEPGSPSPAGLKLSMVEIDLICGAIP